MNRLFLPFLCFCLSWGLARHLGGKASAPAPDPSPVTAGRPPAGEASPSSNRQQPADFARHFVSASTTGWQELWDGFAETATLTDLQFLVRLPLSQPAWTGWDPGAVLQGLATEELALRGGHSARPAGGHRRPRGARPGAGMAGRQKSPGQHGFRRRPAHVSNPRPPRGP